MAISTAQKRSDFSKAKNRCTNQWIHEAHSLDKDCHTQFGTLNHLPPEIRQMIWKELFVFQLGDNLEQNQIRLAPNIPLEPQIFWDYGIEKNVFCIRSYGVYALPRRFRDDRRSRASISPYITWYRRQPIGYNIVKNLKIASPTIRFELETVFLTIHEFSFQNPRMLARFCALYPAGIAVICVIWPYGLEDMNYCLGRRQMTTATLAHGKRPSKDCQVLSGRS